MSSRAAPPPRVRIGLKLWSTNRPYAPLARALRANGVCDYIELFVVPGSEGVIDLWRAQEGPFVLHAPHSCTGLNPAKRAQLVANTALVALVDQYRQALQPLHIVFHPGLDGPSSETIRQFAEFRARFPDTMALALTENKPALGLNGEACVGDSPETLAAICRAAGTGVCLDFGHAMAYAAARGLDGYRVVEEFEKLRPAMYHVAGADERAVQDQHLHIHQGTVDLARLVRAVPAGSLVTIESNKDSTEALDDFDRDAAELRRMVTA